MDEKIIVYPRVSTVMQSIYGNSLMTQKIKGRQLGKELGYKDEQILVIPDAGVSTRKNKLHERPGMSEILKLIRSKEVNGLIVYDRDRMARKMTDHLIIIDELRKNNVKLYFSGEEVTAYTGDFALEASLALYAELEGNKIYQRRNQARKFYPQTIPGYVTVGKGGDKRYEPTGDEEHESIKQLFQGFENIDTLEKFKAFKKKWKSVVKDPQKVLSNGFYAAVLIDEERIIPVTHIPPIVKLETILLNRKKFKKWGLNKQKEIANTILDQMDILVICDKCEKILEQRLIRGEYKYHCNHGSPNSKNRVSLLAQDVINIVFQSISDLCSLIDPKLLENIVIKGLKNQLVDYKKEINKIEKQRSQLRSKITSSLHNVKEIENLLKEEEDISLKRKVKEEMSVDLSLMIQDIKSFLDNKFYEDISTYTWLNLIPSGQLLIHSVRLDYDHVQVVHFLNEAKTRELDNYQKKKG